jgi:cytochrome c oxidase cbb3-type subunit 3
MSNKDGKLLDHDYDGIQELDNQLPRWWLWGFYASIAFAVFYVAYFHFGGGKNPEQEMAAELAAIQEARKAQEPANSGPDEALLAKLLEDKSSLESSSKLFGEKCASCHGAKGEGLIGPNLTDNYWLHGDGTLVSIFHTVSEGVPEKGMPPWKALLKPEEIYAVVAYVKHLDGSSPPNAKAPQGVEVKKN